MAVKPFKTWEGKIYLGESTTTDIAGVPADSGLATITSPSADNLVGRVQEATVNISRELEALFGCGSIDPTDIKAGNRNITGSIRRAITNGIFYAAVIGQDDGATPYAITTKSDSTLSEFKMQLHLAQATNYVALRLKNVKFGTISLTLGSDGGYVMENVDYMGIFDASQYVGDAASGV